MSTTISEAVDLIIEAERLSAFRPRRVIVNALQWACMVTAGAARGLRFPSALVGKVAIEGPELLSGGSLPDWKWSMVRMELRRVFRPPTVARADWPWSPFTEGYVDRDPKDAPTLDVVEWPHVEEPKAGKVLVRDCYYTTNILEKNA